MDFVQPHKDDRALVRRGRTFGPSTGTRSSYIYQLEEFITAVRGGWRMPTDPDDAVATAELIDQCYSAAGLPLRALEVTHRLRRSGGDDRDDQSRLEPLPDGVLETLRKVSTSTIATQLYKRGFRQPQLLGVKPLSDVADGFVGEAYTMRFIPMREDVDGLDRTAAATRCSGKRSSRCSPARCWWSTPTARRRPRRVATC